MTDPRETQTITVTQKPSKGQGKKCCLIAFLVIAGFVLLGAVLPHDHVSSTLPSSHSYATPSAPRTHSVTIEVTGSAHTVDVFHDNNTGGQLTGTYNIPYSRTYSNIPSGTSFYASAQESEGDGGTVTVTIKEDGHIVKTSTSSGRFCIASTSVWID